MNRLLIDGRKVQAEEGESILEAARSAGIAIPSLCYLKDVSAVASCRVCVVDVEGHDAPVPACATPAREGMAVTTSSPRLAAYRRIALELLLADHGISSLADCAACAADGSCELQALCRRFGVGVEEDPARDGGPPRSADETLAVSAEADPARSEGPPESTRMPARRDVLDDNPFLSYDPSLCIACQRCVGACNAGARNRTLQSGHAGLRTTIAAPFGPAWRSSGCESCGACAQACPTGALSAKRQATAERTEPAKRTDRAERIVRTTCPHCGVGCQIDFSVADGKVVSARGADGPSNKGLLCVKGRFASFDFATSPDRLAAPLVRSAETGELEPVSWDEALDLVAERFSEIKRESGPDSLAAFACSRSTNEDVYLLQKLARCAFGTNNIDSCARV